MLSNATLYGYGYGWGSLNAPRWRFPKGRGVSSFRPWCHIVQHVAWISKICRPLADNWKFAMQPPVSLHDSHGFSHALFMFLRGHAGYLMFLFLHNYVHFGKV